MTLFSLLLSAVQTAGATDIIVLHDGSELAGDIVEVRDGHYWIELDNGELIPLSFFEVARVVRDAADRPRDAAEAPRTVSFADDRHEFAEPPERRDRDSGVGGGFEVGAFTGFRLRFHGKRALDHFDLRAGTGVAVTSYGIGPAVLVGFEFGFADDSPVHPVLGFGIGAAAIDYWNVCGGVNIGLQFDTNGPFQVQLAAFVGTDGNLVGVVPDVSVGWVW